MIDADSGNINGVFDPDDLDALTAALEADEAYLARKEADPHECPEHINMIRRFVLERRHDVARRRKNKQAIRAAAMRAQMTRAKHSASKSTATPRPRQPRRARRYAASRASSGESVSGDPAPPSAFQELTARAQWLVWKYQQAANREKPTKPPLSAYTGRKASATDPNNWATFDVAEAARIKFNLNGVGFALADDDDYTAVDLDKCRDPLTGALADWARQIIELAESYTEVSPSGTGIRMILRGKIAKALKCDAAGVERYGVKRYVTMTWDHVEGTPADIRPAPRTNAALEARVAAFEAEAAAKATSEAVEPGQQMQSHILPISRQAVPAAPRAASDGPSYFRRVNDAALANLSAWVPALFPSAKYQPGTGAYRVKPATLGRNCEEDISIAPTGIVDFGIHDMGDPRAGKRTAIDVVMEYGGEPNAAEAARWLCERMGVEPASLGWRDDDADLNFEIVPPGGARFDPETGEIIEDEDIGPEGTAEFIEWLVERAKADAGAPFEVVTLDRLRSVREADAATWQRLRARLKREAKIGVGALDEALDGRHERQKKSHWHGPKSCTEWLDHAKRDDDGRLLSNLENVMAALRHAPEVASAFAFDEMACAVFVMQPLPRVKGGGGVAWTKPGRLTDQHGTQVQEWLQAAGLSKVGGETVRAAIDLRAREEGRSFHPVRDYLETVRWDGKPRIGAWLTDYLGVESTPYTAAVGRMFLIAMVARIYEPGCKVDHTLILEGAQGVSKSTLCAALAGEWFSDSLPDITNDKECSQHLRGKWLIEIAELAAMSRAAANHLKSFLTRRVEQYRPSYGRNEVVEPRQCVFVGTTNDKTYLKDPTGGRRFWPVRVGDVVLHEEIRADRDLLFAEAVAAYKAGERWWPERDFEASHMAAEQAARVDGDAWLDPIADWLATQKPGARVRLVDVANDALGLETARFGKADQNRVKEVLQNLGWEKHAKRRDGYPVWQKTLPKGMPSEI